MRTTRFRQAMARSAFPPRSFKRHIAYDPGAAGITRHMARILGAPAVLTRYSRLLIDPNRGEDDPTLIMRISDGAIVPGNSSMTAAERAEAHRTFTTGPTMMRSMA